MTASNLPIAFPAEFEGLGLEVLEIVALDARIAYLVLCVCVCVCVSSPCRASRAQKRGRP
jgi:hypothetical protein